ncbi:hypothetical protein BER2_1117 [plant metagenome]|uniref:Uncharacterized protein n=1 Tax=plant metagenome TaxID=1297885 RepID=A0A484TNZ7_9ZZZZ
MAPIYAAGRMLAITRKAAWPCRCGKAASHWRDPRPRRPVLPIRQAPLLDSVLVVPWAGSQNFPHLRGSPQVGEEKNVKEKCA